MATESKQIYYEVIRMMRGSLLFLDAHLKRLSRSLGRGSGQTIDLAVLRAEICRFIEVHGSRDQNLKISVNCGENMDITVSYIASHYPDAAAYREGCRAMTVEFERESPQLKRQSAALHALRQRLTALDIYDYIICDSDSCMTEGSKSNVFFVKDRTIFMPERSKALAGVTQTVLLELVAQHFTLQEGCVKRAQLSEYQAAFFTGTSIGVFPISQIDGRPFASPTHPIVRELSNYYSEVVERYLARQPLNWQINNLR